MVVSVPKSRLRWWPGGVYSPLFVAAAWTDTDLPWAIHAWNRWSGRARIWSRLYPHVSSPKVLAPCVGQSLVAPSVAPWVGQSWVKSRVSTASRRESFVALTYIWHSCSIFKKNKWRKFRVFIFFPASQQLQKMGCPMSQWHYKFSGCSSSILPKPCTCRIVHATHGAQMLTQPKHAHKPLCMHTYIQRGE